MGHPRRHYRCLLAAVTCCLLPSACVVPQLDPAAVARARLPEPSGDPATNCQPSPRLRGLIDELLAAPMSEAPALWKRLRIDDEFALRFHERGPRGVKPPMLDSPQSYEHWFKVQRGRQWLIGIRSFGGNFLALAPRSFSGESDSAEFLRCEHTNCDREASAYLRGEVLRGMRLAMFEESRRHSNKWGRTNAMGFLESPTQRACDDDSFDEWASCVSAARSSEVDFLNSEFRFPSSGTLRVEYSTLRAGTCPHVLTVDLATGMAELGDRECRHWSGQLDLRRAREFGLFVLTQPEQVTWKPAHFMTIPERFSGRTGCARFRFVPGPRMSSHGTLQFDFVGEASRSRQRWSSGSAAYAHGWALLDELSMSLRAGSEPAPPR